MRKVLIISKLFFPQPSVGAVRMTQWCRYLPAEGWEPTVICLRQNTIATPEMVAVHVHPAVRVYYLGDQFRAKVKRGRGNPVVQMRRRVVRAFFRTSVANLFVPDFAKFEWMPHRERIRAIMSEVKPDVILTTSTPHSVHELGMWLSRETGVPWVADFRDPYLSDSRFGPRGIGRLVSWRHEAFERDIYEQAALVTHAIPSHQRYAEQRYPRARDRMAVIPNGVPGELLDGTVDALRSPNGSRSIRIVGHNEDTEARLAADAVRLLTESGQDVELRIVGSPPGNEATLRRLLGENLVLAGRVPHAEALREIAGADVLLSALSRKRAACQGLSSKLFEFLASGRPIVQVNPTQPDRELVNDVASVITLVAPSPGELANALTRALATPNAALEMQRNVARKYRRDEQARHLARLLDRLVS